MRKWDNPKFTKLSKEKCYCDGKGATCGRCMNMIFMWSEDEVARQRQEIIEQIKGMKKPTLGNPEWTSSIEDRIYNKTIDDLLERLEVDNG